MGNTANGPANPGPKCFIHHINCEQANFIAVLLILLHLIRLCSLKENMLLVARTFFLPFSLSDLEMTCLRISQHLAVHTLVLTFWLHSGWGITLHAVPLHLWVCWLHFPCSASSQPHPCGFAQWFRAVGASVHYHHSCPTLHVWVLQGCTCFGYSVALPAPRSPLSPSSPALAGQFPPADPPQNLLNLFFH